MRTEEKVYWGAFHNLSGSVVKKEQILLSTSLEQSIEMVLEKYPKSSLLVKSSHWALCKLEVQTAVTKNKKAQQATESHTTKKVNARLLIFTHP